MTPSQSIQLRQSELRTKLAALLETPTEKRSDSFTDDVGKLTSELKSTETELQAALVLDGEPEQRDVEPESTPEQVELREQEYRAEIGGILDAVFTSGKPEGAESELQQHLGLADNQIPLVLLRDDIPDMERRTSGVTPAPGSGEVGAVQHPIIAAVFPQAAATFLQIPQPRVAVGEQVYTVLSTSAAPGTPAKGADQYHSTGAFTAKVLSPKRIQASMFYAREDAARMRGMGESIRTNLSDALADKLDDRIIHALSTGSELTSNNATAADDYASYRKRFAYDRTDGTYASVSRDLRMIVGSDTYADMAETYRSNNSEANALMALMEETSGVRVSAHIPDTASNKQNGIVRRGSRRDAVAPIWEGITVITDEVTQAKAGEIVLTAVMLYAYDTLRTSGFAKVQAQHS